jgi:hypothetical protein
MSYIKHENPQKEPHGLTTNDHSEWCSLKAVVCLFSTQNTFFYIPAVYLMHSTQPASSATDSWSRFDCCRVDSNRSVMSCVLPTMQSAKELYKAAEKLSPIPMRFLLRVFMLDNRFQWASFRVVVGGKVAMHNFKSMSIISLYRNIVP